MVKRFLVNCLNLPWVKTKMTGTEIAKVSRRIAADAASAGVTTRSTRALPNWAYTIRRKVGMHASMSEKMLQMMRLVSFISLESNVNWFGGRCIF